MINQTAPGRLEEVRDFVNTLDLETGIDELSDPEALRSWLVEHALLGEGAKVGPAAFRRTIALREALRTLLLANNGMTPSRGAIDTVNQAMSDAALSVRLDPEGRPALRVRGYGPGLVPATIVAIAYEAMANGTWSRLKACPADDCHYAFYDHSKNHSGTWCDMAVCGNRAKVRAYRERKSRGG